MTSRWRPFRQRGAHPQQDDGAILILAIIIITTVALVVGAVLTRGSGSLKATVELRNVVGTSYSADSAANIAINGLRTGYGFLGTDKFDNALAGAGGSTDGKGCFGNDLDITGSDALSLDGFYPATGTVGLSSAYIECTGEKGTGAQGSPVQISNDNKPGQAILTLGKKSTLGLDFGQATAETDYIHGSVTSNRVLNSKGTLSLSGVGVKVNAVGGCTGTPVVVNEVVTPCGAVGIPDPGLSSSKYDPPTATPVLAEAPICPIVAGGPQIYSPGLYTMTPDDAGVKAEIQTITLSPGTASGTFTPSYVGLSAGAQVYNVPPATLQTAMRTAWKVDVTVTGVAGTSYTVTFPTILGDVAQMTKISALGPGSKSATIATPTSGSSTCSPTPGWKYFAPNSPTSTGIYYFNWPGAWSVSGATVGGTLSTAKDGTTSGGTSISPPRDNPVAPTSVGTCVNPILDPKAVGVEMVFGGASQMSLSGSALKQFCASYSPSSIPTVVYGLKTPVGTGTYQVPAQSGCIVSSSPCPMINAAKASKAAFNFNGFVYAPWAYVYLNANNNSKPFFNFGLITDSLFVGANPSTTCDKCAFINLPDNSLGYGTKSTTALIKVHVCPGSATVNLSCRDNPPALTARVQLWDIDGDKSKRQITILSWNRVN